MFFLLKIGAYHSRGALVSFGVLGLGALIGSRWFISRRLGTALARGTLAGTPAVVIGDDQSLAEISRRDLLRRFGASEIGRFKLPFVPSCIEDSFAVLDEAIESARLNLAEQVLLALPWANEQQREIVCERLQTLPVSVSLLPDQKVSTLLSRSGRNVGTDFAIELQRPPLSSQELTAKRASDLLLAGTMTVLLAPLLAFVSLLIKIDSPGPVLFRQRRRGFNGREFTIYKFRTMHVLEDGPVIPQAQRNDTRVTRFGRVLRATSIDELPQLINVIRGHMSLVGPRPHAVAHDDGYAKLIANYAFRQHVKPGLTGWAQVHGFRGETAYLALMEQRVTLDLWYIKHWSIWLDLRIIGLTCFELIRRQDAY
jgi:undecaprenyl-phosphate galactose phosphotransferase/putative colanic acid biosynthesis UDP-glucose lipid carrier transferase